MVVFVYSHEWYQVGLVHVAVGAVQLSARALCQAQTHILEEVLCSFCLLQHIKRGTDQRLFVN